GVLTVLSFTSMCFLLRHRSLTHTNVRILVFSTVLLYLSNGTYVAALIWNRTQANRLVLGAMDGLFSPSHDGAHEMGVFEDGMRKQRSMAVFALQINWMVGDSVVWWRACVIWRNKVVYCLGPLLVTFSLGVSRSIDHPGIVWTTGLTFLNVYNPFFDAFAISSLTTNVLATSLIAYKAWEHRREVKKYFSEAGAKSQILKTLALLVESGTIYCAMTVYFIVFYSRGMLVPSSVGGAETKAATYVIYGCIGPVVAIYPTMILFLVVLKISPTDNGGLPQVRRVHASERGVRRGREATGSTIIFRHSAFHGPTTGDLDDAVASSTGDRWDAHSSESCPMSMTMCAEHVKDVHTLV
ncbi:hypothetical protein V8D89_009816, partial [Ganoderma adspersum]